MDRRPPLRILLAIGLVAGATLALQVLLTRLFAAVLYYHFGFLAISLALLGVGGGAILIYVRPSWFESLELERALARWTMAFSALTVAVMVILVRLDYSLVDGVTAKFVLNLTVACSIAALPFFAAGIAVALAVRGYTRHIGQVYAFDLAGAGLGAVAVVPLLWVTDAPTLVVGLGLIGALASLMFAGVGRPETRMAFGLAGLACAALVLSAATKLYYLPTEGSLKPAVERWTPLGRVLGYLPPPQLATGLVAYDRNVGEVVPYRKSKPPGWEQLQEGPQSVGYEIAGPGDSLVVGGGGGRDILTALSTGQRRVDVIELNRGIRDVVDKDLRSFSGGPYSLPRVNTTIGDGRSTLAGRDRDYDHIQLGFVDTFSASSTQAFALTENNLYTVEAFGEYLDHLKPGGILNVARPNRHQGDEALRATVLALETLRRRGVANPERNVAVVLGRYGLFVRPFPYGAVIIKEEPFTPAELARIRSLAGERGEGLAYAPGGPYRGNWKLLNAAESPQAFCESYALDVCAPTDDKPFFFHMKRLGDLFGTATSDTLGLPDPMLLLVVTLAVMLGLGVLAFVVPLALVRGEGRPPVGSLAFFAAIGLGFLVLEIVLIQRFVLFLGFPTYALSVVLAALLLSSGAGSLLSARLGGDPRRTLVGALSVAIVLIAAASVGLQPLLRALIDLPFAARLLLSVLLLAPVGVVLGMAMPIGLGRLSGLYPDAVAWAWGINGITSVLASVLGVAIVLVLGFTATTVVALLCYGVALAHVLLGRWPEPAEHEIPAGGEKRRKVRAEAAAAFRSSV